MSTPQNPQFDIQNVLKRAQNLDISPKFQPYSCVEIVTGKETEDWDGVYRSPEDPVEFENAKANGRLLTINNEWGTQDQADNILASIRGFIYQPYVAGGALVDPNAELGDGVSVNGVYSGIYKMSRNFSSLMAADIEAPQSEEIDHEYPYESTGSRQTIRKFSAMESELRFNSQEIEAKVSKQSPVGQTSFSWSLQNSSWEVKSNGSTVFKITSEGAEVKGRITATSGSIGGFTINENNSNAIQYSGLTWNGNKQGIYIGTQGIQLGAANNSYFQASASGNVIARNITLLGTLYFKDANGNTKSINANNLRAGAASAFNNGGTWTSTSNGWNGATSGNNAVNTFYAANLYAVKKFIFGVREVSLQWVRTTDGGQIRALCVS